MTSPQTHNGYASFAIPDSKYQASTYYKVIGDLSLPQPVLLTVHGGPGAGHDYLTSLTDLHHQLGLTIIFYDAIGGAKSTHFRDKFGDQNFWTVSLFVHELDNLINVLNLRVNGFYLFGHSFGGVIAGTYAAQQPVGLEKLVIASGPADMNLYVQGTRALLMQLPDTVRTTIEKCEGNGDYESPEYEAAKTVFLERHICKMETWPQPLRETFANIANDSTAYFTLQGPSDFDVVGSMRDWEGWSTGHLITVATLLTNGQYDEVQDACMKPWFDTIHNVKWIKFEQSSHMPHWEEREKYMKALADFLAK